MVDYLSTIKTLHLHGTQIVVSGGSSGIGRGIAIQYAALGASVAIVGRTCSAGEEALAEIERAAPPDAKARFKFIQSDLSLVSGMHQAANDIQEWSGEKGVQYLIQTQGIAPVSTPVPTSDGYETFFAIQSLSRFALPYLLFSSGVLHPTSTVFHIAIAGIGKAFIPQAEDIDLTEADRQAGGAVGFLTRGPNACSVIDCVTKELSLRYPRARFVHMMPGVVNTGLASRSDNYVWWVKAFAHITQWVGLASSTDDFAATAVYAVSGLPKDDEAFKALCLNAKVKAIAISGAAEDKDVRDKIWVKLEKMIQI